MTFMYLVVIDCELSIFFFKVALYLMKKGFHFETEMVCFMNLKEREKGTL